jgi:antitoxin ParD1/3/4
MNVSLTPQLEKFVDERVAKGQYASASEVVRAGLRLLQARETAREALRRQVAVGLKQARRGKLVDGEKVFDALEKPARKRRRKAG